MSLTQSDGLFVAVHEDGFNDFITVFFSARPRYLKFGSPLFVPSTSVSATAVPAIAFPNIPGGINYMVEFERPVLDLHPDTKGFDLPPMPNQFSMQIKVRLTLACIKEIKRGDDKRYPKSEPIHTDLVVCASGSIDRGPNDLGLHVDQVEIKDITPDSLESIIECIIRMMLQAALVPMRIPYNAIGIEIGNIVPADGPRIQDDQVQLSANFI